MRQESGRWADAEQMPYRPRRRVRCTLPSRATGKPYLRPVIETSVINMSTLFERRAALSPGSLRLVWLPFWLPPRGRSHVCHCLPNQNASSRCVAVVELTNDLFRLDPQREEVISIRTTST